MTPMCTTLCIEYVYVEAADFAINYIYVPISMGILRSQINYLNLFYTKPNVKIYDTMRFVTHHL